MNSLLFLKHAYFCRDEGNLTYGYYFVPNLFNGAMAIAPYKHYNLRYFFFLLMIEFPDMKGFSLRNIKYIRQWYLFYCEENEKEQQIVAQLIQIPWGHNLHIITKCKKIDEALYYVNQTLQYGWNEYKLSNTLPKEFKSTLPSIEEIEAELNKE